MPSPHHQPAPAAFFDRDGVINIDHGYVHLVEDFALVKGAAEALRRCNEAGYRVFIVTNQAGVAQGYYDEAAVEVLHRHMQNELAAQGARIDDIRYCPHHPDAARMEYRLDCGCRKPMPGMLLDLIDTWGIDVSRSFMIGDKDSDMQAAAGAGVRGYKFSSGNLDTLVSRLVER